MHYIILLMMCLLIFFNCIGNHSKIQNLTLNGNKRNRIVKHCDRDVVWQLVGVGTLNLVNPIQTLILLVIFF
jgi:hypothetical protein